MLQKEDPSKAIGLFENILKEKPDNYGVLVKVIDFYRKCARIKEC